MLRATGLLLVGLALTLPANGETGRGETSTAIRLRTALDSITGDDLQRHVDVLSDDSFEGREAGTRGGRAAGGYLSQHFRDLGLEPAGEDGSFYQTFGRGFRNVIGRLPGSDPDRADEIILIGAHYDHVGYGTRRNSYGPIGYIHNGADDNASGTAGLLELIEAFGTLDENPARSIVFALWDGEEKGLFGSKHFVANPTVPLEKVTLAVNLDMIGRLRDERVEVYGTRTGYGLRRMLARGNDATNLRMDFTWEIKDNSDHYPFFERGIPIVMLHTGLHDDYHRPSDDAHTVNADGMREVSRLLFRFAYDAAYADSPPRFRRASRREGPLQRQRLERAAARRDVRLGIRWRIPADDRGEELEEAGLPVTFVHPNSAADRAGLRVGDRIIGINGRAIRFSSQFRQLVWAAPRETTLEVRREHEAQTLAVSLDGQPVRVGLSWRSDDAEPGSVLIAGIVPGSAADAAGLQRLDRILSVNGDRIAGSVALQETLTQSPGPFQMLVEREGRLREVRIELLAETAAGP